jgi:hypothetical protein
MMFVAIFLSVVLLLFVLDDLISKPLDFKAPTITFLITQDSTKGKTLRWEDMEFRWLP